MSQIASHDDRGSCAPVNSRAAAQEETSCGVWGDRRLLSATIGAAVLAVALPAGADGAGVGDRTLLGAETGALDALVDVGSGNLVVRGADASLAEGVAAGTLSRTYNSQDQTIGAFGPGWRLDNGPDVRLDRPDAATVVVKDGSGFQARFTRRPDSTWAGPEEFALEAVGTGWRLDDDTAARRLEFDSSGTLSAVLDDVGNRFSTSYTSAAGAQVFAAVQSADGKAVRSSLDGQRRIIELDDPLSRHWLYRYDSGGRLARVEAPSGSTSFSYDGPAGQLSAINAPDGSRWEFAYDTSNRVIRYAFVGGSQTAWTSLRYEPAGTKCAGYASQTVATFSEGQLAPASERLYCVRSDGRADYQLEEPEYPIGDAAAANLVVTVSLAQENGTEVTLPGVIVGVEDSAGNRRAIRTDSEGRGSFALPGGTYSIELPKVAGVDVSGPQTALVGTGRTDVALRLMPQAEFEEDATTTSRTFATAAQAPYPSGAKDFVNCVSSTPLRICREFFKDALLAEYVGSVLFGYQGGVPDSTRANAFKHSYAVARFTRTLRADFPGERLSYAYDFADGHEERDRKSDLITVRRASFMDTNNNLVGYHYARKRPSLTGGQLCTKMRGKIYTAVRLQFGPGEERAAVPENDADRRVLFYIKSSRLPVEAQYFPRFQACEYALRRYEPPIYG